MLDIHSFGGELGAMGHQYGFNFIFILYYIILILGLNRRGTVLRPARTSCKVYFVREKVGRVTAFPPPNNLENLL